MNVQVPMIATLMALVQTLQGDTLVPVMQGSRGMAEYVQVGLYVCLVHSTTRYSGAK